MNTRRAILAFLLLLPFTLATRADIKDGRDRDETPRFSRQVAAIFSRLGCNSGVCHGAVNGQNGFRLTLFGANPALDHDRLQRELGGRRLNFQAPEASLLLLKATGQASHGGGKRLEVGSAEYEII